MAVTLLLLALPLGAWSQSASSCGAAGDHFSDVKITISPDPIAKGTPFTIDVTGNLDAALTALNADIDLNVKALGIIDKSVKLSSPLTISPGIQAGAQTVSVGPVTLPNMPGSVEAQGTITITNDKKEPVACIKLDLNVPAESTEVAPAASTEVEATPAVSVCSGASDHLQNLKWDTASGVATVTGSLDEAITKATTVLDLTVKLGFLSHKIDMNIPFSYTPGFAKGDVKIVAGPLAKDGLAQSLIPEPVVTGTIKINDGSSSEIACLSLDNKAVETIQV